MRARLASLRGDWDRLDADLAEVHRLPVVLEVLRCEALAEALLWRGDQMQRWPRWSSTPAPRPAAACTVGAVGLARLPGPGDVGDGRAGRVRRARRRRLGRTRRSSTTWSRRLRAGRRCPGAAAELRVLCARSAPVREGPGVAPWRPRSSAGRAADRPYLLAYARWRLAQAQVAERSLAAAAEEPAAEPRRTPDAWARHRCSPRSSPWPGVPGSTCGHRDGCPPVSPVSVPT